ncbi:MAG: KpsF/GutQ family sugar-phosphate isomerase [Lentisphaeria bacterium]
MIDIIEEARRVFDIEVEGLQAVRDQLDSRFIELVELCKSTLDNDGKIVFSGVGKSGHIGCKLSATFSSTGSRAAFLNPVEAMHGDLGMISPKDLLIAISYSGETDELLPVIPAVQRFGVKVVAITGVDDSRLSEFADLTIPMPVPREACPFGLAPTTSTTALLALGDALGIVLLKYRGFSKEQFGLYHPGGSIGRSVTLKVNDIMRKVCDIPLVLPNTVISECIMLMTKKRSGSVLVVAESGELVGIFTDGDFRRHAQTGIERLLSLEVSELMTKDPVSIRDNSMAVVLMQLLEKRRIDDIPVVDADNCPVGLVDIQDLPRFKLM